MYEVVDKKLKIASIDSIQDIRVCEWWSIKNYLKVNELNIDQITFFYIKENEYIVLNKKHGKYEFYLDLIRAYLSVDDALRREFVMNAPSPSIRFALRELDKIIMERECNAQQSIAG